MKILNSTGFKDGVFKDMPICEGLYPVMADKSKQLWSNWPENKESPPDNYPATESEYYFLDIEHWGHNEGDVLHTSTYDRSIGKYLYTLKKAKEANPDKKVAYYNIPGVWPSDFIYSEDKAENSRNWLDTYKRIADAQDYLAPSLYVDKWLENAERWYKHADMSVNYLRKFNKPIIPFIWWHWKDTTEYLGDDFFYMILDFCKENADGAIIWTNHLDKYDPDMGYEDVIRKFL